MKVFPTKMVLNGNRSVNLFVRPMTIKDDQRPLKTISLKIC